MTMTRLIKNLNRPNMVNKKKESKMAEKIAVMNAIDEWARKQVKASAS